MRNGSSCVPLGIPLGGAVSLVSTHSWQINWLVAGSAVQLLATIPFHEACASQCVTAGFPEFPEERNQSCQYSQWLSLERTCVFSFPLFQIYWLLWSFLGNSLHLLLPALLQFNLFCIFHDYSSHFMNCFVSFLAPLSPHWFVCFVWLGLALLLLFLYQWDLVGKGNTLVSFLHYNEIPNTSYFWSSKAYVAHWLGDEVQNWVSIILGPCWGCWMEWISRLWNEQLHFNSGCTETKDGSGLTILVCFLLSDSRVISSGTFYVKTIKLIDM